HEGSDADSRHTQCGKLAKREASRTVEDVCRAKGEVLPDLGCIRQEDRINAIGAGIEILPGTLQAFLDGTLVVVDVDPSVDDQVDAARASSGLDRGNAFRLAVGVDQGANTMVGVFEVRSAGASPDEAIDEFFRRQS